MKYEKFPENKIRKLGDGTVICKVCRTGIPCDCELNKFLKNQRFHQ